MLARTKLKRDRSVTQKEARPTRTVFTHRLPLPVVRDPLWKGGIEVNRGMEDEDDQ